MSEDEKAPGMTIRIPAPRLLAAASRSLDPRTAEVLRALDRAKGQIVETEALTASPSAAANLARELRASREGLSKTTPSTEETAHSLYSSARVLERVVAVASERLADFQRGQDGIVKELRESAHGLKRQADALAAWRAWWTSQLTASGIVLALLFTAGIALAWRAHLLAQSTHDILEQILQNQTQAQAARGGKRR